MRFQEYKKLITAAFAQNTRGGLVDSRNCRRLCLDVSTILEEVQEDLRRENRYAELFKLCSWAYVKWEKTNKDDSYGETGDFCRCVYTIWEVIYREGEQSLPHDKMLELFLEQLDGKAFDYLEDRIYEFILGNFKSKEELARKEQFLIKVMKELKQTPDYYENDLYLAEHYYAQVLADQMRPIQEIRELLNSRDSYVNKTLLAQIETKYGNYDEAISLYKDQIEERPNSYWSNDPRKALMEIYSVQGNTEAYNEELFNMMLTNAGAKEWFLEYKALFAEEEWKKRWEDILVLFKGRLSQINPWLSIENRYDIIMDNAEPDADYIVDAYGKELFELYPERCFKVLANAADRYAENSNSRRGYRDIAKTLKKIAAHPGGGELAAELAEKYRAKYPRRSAMLDVLKKF